MITTPTIGQVLATLDELAAAVRNNNAPRYRRALQAAARQEISQEQILDAYRWGRCHRLDAGGPSFTAAGEDTA